MEKIYFKGAIVCSISPKTKACTTICHNTRSGPDYTALWTVYIKTVTVTIPESMPRLKHTLQRNLL